MEPTEDQLQIYAADLLRSFAHPWLVWYHCPNGGWRNIVIAKLLKAFGVRPGVADLCFVDRDGFSSFIEIKTRKGRLNDDQIKFKHDVQANKCSYTTCRSPEEIKKSLIDAGFLDTVRLGGGRKSGESQRGSALPAAPLARAA